MLLAKPTGLDTGLDKVLILLEYSLCLTFIHVRRDQALQVLDYPERLQKLLLTPHRELHVELNITRDSGEIEIFNAYRVQHDNSRGPFKGGFRFHPNVSMDDVRRCAIGLILLQMLACC